MFSKNIEKIFTSDLFSSILRPKTIDIKQKSRILVVAPHPDDEAIGMGGALTKEATLKSSISILYCTSKDGEKRYNEAKILCKKSGFDYYFLKCKDKNIEISSRTISFIRDIYNKCLPEKIYLPLFCDSHDDHKRVSELIYESLKDSSLSNNLEIYCYQVYSFIPTNCVLDITKEINKKHKLINFYKSIKTNRNWVHWSSGMNAYLSRFLGSSQKKKYAETFLKYDVKEYFKICSVYFRKKFVIYNNKNYF